MPSRLPALRTALLALCVLVAACGQREAPKKGPVEVGVVTLATQDVTVSTELPGRTASTMMSEVRPQVAGEIGRASGRERVCQCVKIQVVAESLNKKNKDNTEKKETK